MTFRFLHAADLHLDTPFAGVGAAAPAVAEALRDASLGVLDDLVRLAIARDVAFVVLAGDLYDGADRGVRAQLAVHRATTTLADHGIRTFIAHGNHDPVEEGWSAVRSWPELVTVFPTDRVATVVVERGGVPVATVHGISYARRDTTENLSRRFARSDDPGFHVGVLHANVGAHGEHQPYSPCSVDDLAWTGLDYWALGHVHRHQVLHRDPWVVYPGTPQGRSPAPREQGPKGAVLVGVDDGGRVASLELVPLDRVRVAEVAVDLADADDLADLRGRLVAAGRRALLDADGRSVLLRGAVAGRGPLHHDLTRPAVVDELLRDLRDEGDGSVPFVWWHRLDVRTGADRDLDDLRGRSDFLADLLDQHAALVDGHLADRTAGWLDELPAGVVRALADALPDPAAPARWDAALELAVDLVAGDDGDQP